MQWIKNGNFISYNNVDGRSFNSAKLVGKTRHYFVRFAYRFIVQQFETDHNCLCLYLLFFEKLGRILPRLWRICHDAVSAGDNSFRILAFGKACYRTEQISRNLKAADFVIPIYLQTLKRN